MLIVGSLILLATLVIKLFSYMNWNLKSVKELFIRCRGRPEVVKEEPLPLLSELMIDFQKTMNNAFDNKDRRLERQEEMEHRHVDELIADIRAIKTDMQEINNDMRENRVDINEVIDLVDAEIRRNYKILQCSRLGEQNDINNLF